MLVGLIILGTAVNFYLYADLSRTPLGPDVESWRALCSGGVFFLGAILILSTYGRFKKARAARKAPAARR